MSYFSHRAARFGIIPLFVVAAIFFHYNAVPAFMHQSSAKKHTAPHIETGVLYSIVRVIDGDTVDVDINGQTERIRLIGLDTPETVDPRKPVQCFGKEASDKAKSILTGQKVKIETDPSQGLRDKYGRLLAYIFLPDGTLFNQTMIEEGYGHEYTYNLPYKYQTEFKASQVRVRELKKGLWADGVCG